MTDEVRRPKGATRHTAMFTKRRIGAEDGAALVEFSISVVLLLVILFGIITFGVILSFRQGMTQAAAEGVRAAVPVDHTEAAAVAQSAAEKSTLAFGKRCNDGDGLACDFDVEPCSNATSAWCITVNMVYDYDAHPLVPKLPFISAVLPKTMTVRSVAQVTS